MSRLPQDGKIECPHCGCGNYPRAYRCVECETPLPRRRTATGRAAPEEQERPQPLFAVIGVWLIFGPFALFCVAYLVEGFPHLIRGLFFRGFDDFFASLLMLGLLGAGLYISFTIIRRTTRGYRQEQARRRREKDDDDEDYDDGGAFGDEDDEDDE